MGSHDQMALAQPEGYTNDEITAELRVRTRKIERMLSLVHDLWSQGDQPSG